MKRKIVGIILLIIVLLISFKVIAFLSIDFSTFNSELWDKYTDQRSQMIRDFEKKYPMETLNKENVIELLGEKHMTKTDGMWSYVVGSGGVLGGEYYALVFDENGQCVDRQVYYD